MSSYPEIPEPTYREMSALVLKKNIAIEGRRRKKAVLALAIGVLTVVAFREAWDRGIIALVAVNIWNMLCHVAADWKAFLQEAFR